MMWKKGFIFLMFISLSVFSQNYGEYRFEKLTTSEGLSYNQVTCFFQDHKGLMWVGTTSGLNSFDGYHFRNRFPVLGDSVNLIHANVIAITEDNENRLLIGTRRGLFIYDHDLDLFYQAQIQNNNGSTSNSISVNCFAKLNNGLMLVGTQSGIYELHNGKLTPFSTRMKQLEKSQAVSGMLLDRNGFLWVQTVGNNPVLKKINLGTGDIEYHRLITTAPYWGIYQDYLSNIWVGADKGLVRLDYTSKTQDFFEAPEGFHSINSFYGSPDGRIWQGFWSYGMTSFDIGTKKFVIYKNEPDKQESLSSNHVNAFYQDAGGVLWIGTDEGICKVNQDKQLFSLLSVNLISGKAISSNKVSYSLKSRSFSDRMYLGTNGNGLHIVNSVTKKAINIGPQGDVICKEKFVNHLLEDVAGNLWLSGNYNLYQITSTQEGVKKVKEIFEPFQYYVLQSIEDPIDEDVLWIGTTTSLIRYSKSNGDKTEYKIPSVENPFIRQLFFSGNFLYLAIQDGFAEFNPESGNFKTWFRNEIGFCTSIMKKGENELFVGTNNSGLYVFNTLNKKFKHFPIQNENGLNDINSLQLVGGDLWFGTNLGIAKYNLSSRTMLLYNSQDGLPSNIVNSITKTEDGKFLISTNNGLANFNYNFRHISLMVPSLLVTYVKSLNTGKIIQYLGEGKKDRAYQFDHLENSLSIGFAAMDYSNPGKNIFRFKLTGLDKEWREAQTHSEVTYNNLDPGVYTFELVGANSEGLWNLDPIKVTISIEPPFYLTKWFIALATFAFSTVVYLIFYFYRRQKKSAIQETDVLLLPVSSYRMILAFGTFIYPFTGWFYHFVDDSVDFNIGFEAILSGLMLLALIGTFKSHFIKEKITLIVQIGYYLLVLHSFYLVYSNNLVTAYMVGLFIVMGGSSLVLTSFRQIFSFSSICIFLAIVVVYALPDPEYNSFLFLASVVTSILLAFLTMTARANLQNKLLFTDSIVSRGHILVVASDNKGNIMYANEGMKNALGYVLEDIMGDKWWQLRTTDSEELEKLRDDVINNVKEGVPYTNAIRDKAGKRHWIQWVDTRINEDIVAGIGQDVTGQVEIQERYQHLVENASDIICRMNQKGIFVYVNDVAESVTGYSKDEILGQHFTYFVSEDFSAQAILHYEKVLADKPATSYYEFPITTKAGETKWIGQSVKTLIDPYDDKKVIGYQAIARDISEKINAENKLKEYSAKLEILNVVQDSLLNATSINEIVENAFSVMTESLHHCDRISLGIFDTINGVAQYKFVRDGIFETHEFKLKELRSYEDLLNRKGTLMQDLRKESELSASDQVLVLSGVKSYYVFPILFRGKLLGSINTAFTKANSITSHVKGIIEEVADSLAVVIHQMHLQDILKEKNEDITASINYARRIQQAILPERVFVDRVFPNNFILYKPRDIVSGDFYWMDLMANKVFFALGDCTGHGVPGAMLSMLATDLLNQTINEKRLIAPDLMLKHLCIAVTHTLKTNESGLKDGFDLGICAFNFENNELEFSGANHSLYLVRDEVLTKFKGEKSSIEPKSEFSELFFELHTIEIQSGDQFYMHTDGFVDQFGGERNKKFKTSHLEEILLEASFLPMKEQKDFFDKNFESWKRNFTQTDDVTIIGLRIA